MTTLAQKAADDWLAGIIAAEVGQLYERGFVPTVNDAGKSVPRTADDLAAAVETFRAGVGRAREAYRLAVKELEVM